MGRKRIEEREPTKEMFAILADENKQEKIMENDKVEELTPKIGSSDWTSFVLSKLSPDELFNGCPTYEGLRRICYDLLGTITDVDIDPVQAPNPQNGNHSCIVAKITIEHPINFNWLGDIAGRTIKYSQICDVFMGNGGKDTFAWRFSSATCWTRTKAALLRDAFRLKFVYTKEEMSELSDSESGVDGYINSNQVDIMDMICSRLNVNAGKFIKGVWKKNKPNDNTDDLNLVPYSVACQSVMLINPWQQDKSKIKPEVVGYDKNWKKEIKNY